MGGVYRHGDTAPYMDIFEVVCFRKAFLESWRAQGLGCVGREAGLCPTRVGGISPDISESIVATMAASSKL